MDVDAGGDAYVVWERFDGTEFRVQSTILSAAGVQGLVHTISDQGGFAYNPQVAVDDNGDAVIVYDRTAGMVHVVHGVKMSPADTVGTPETLSDDAQTAAIPHVAVDDDGDGVVTWYRFDGFDNRIQAATIAANGVSEPPSRSPTPASAHRATGWRSTPTATRWWPGAAPTAPTS